MKKIILGLLPLLMSIGIQTFAQTVIDYQAWNPSTPPCNLFGSTTNVPATINGIGGTITHLTAIGQPQYDGTNNSVNLGASISSGTNVGTEYRITYSFQKGYSYKITINAARTIFTGSGPDDKLRLDLNTGGSGTNSSCNGSATIDNSESGNLKQSKAILNTSFNNYEYVYNSLPSSQNYLMVAGVPVLGSASQTIYIRKITIEITGTAELTLSPTSLPLTCGTVANQTFTVSNPNSVQNITSYEWDLGSSSNGWIYNGSAAPQNISTSTNSITLTPTCGSALSNVSVTVRVNGFNYKTYTCSVSVTSPSMSINGATTICTGTSNYYINSLPCNASVSWSVAPAGVVSLSCTSCSSTTLTKLADGVVTLTATITNVCGLASIPLTKSITIGKPIISSNDALMIYSQPGDENEVCRYEGTTFNFTVSGDTSVIWNATSHQGGSWPSWNQAGDNLYVEFFTAAQQTLIMHLDASNSCGSTTYDFGFRAIDCSSRMMSSNNQFTVSPNPANDVIKITSAEVPGMPKKPITQLIIFDFNKNIVAQKKYNNEAADLNISSLKPGVYYIQIISEKYSETQTILKK